MTETPDLRPAPDDVPPLPNAHDRRLITSEELLGGTREVLIQHAGELYRLRLTRNGKLILQK